MGTKHLTLASQAIAVFEAARAYSGEDGVASTIWGKILAVSGHREIVAALLRISDDLDKLLVITKERITQEKSQRVHVNALTALRTSVDVFLVSKQQWRALREKYLNDANFNLLLALDATLSNVTASIEVDTDEIERLKTEFTAIR